MAKGTKPTALEEDDPLDAELLSLTADQLAERMKLEAVRTLGRILKSPLSKPTDLLRAAEAMLRFEEAESDGKRPTSAMTDAELLALARGPGTHPDPTLAGHDAPRPPKQTDPRSQLANPVAERHTMARDPTHNPPLEVADHDQHKLSVLLRKPAAPATTAGAARTPEPWE